MLPHQGQALRDASLPPMGALEHLMTDRKNAVRTTGIVFGPNPVLISSRMSTSRSPFVSGALADVASFGAHAAAPQADQAARAMPAADAAGRSPEIGMGKAGSVRAAVAALVLTVVSALAVFPFILPSIPA